MSAKDRKQQLEEMLADFPDDAFLRYGLAMEHVSAGDDEAALRAFQECLRVDPGYVPAYMQAGRARARLGRTAEAQDTFRRGIQAAQQKGDLHALEEMRAFLDELE